jgi:SAM-dependent methyltransferase
MTALLILAPMRRPSQAGELSLPPRQALAYAGPDDPLEYYYRPHTAWLYRARLRLALELLGPGPFESMLDVGCGSGILLPDLSRRAERVLAIDVHRYVPDVAAAMDRLGVRAEIKEGSLFEVPAGDGEFDCLVCLSVLEHVTDLEAAFQEFERVLRPGAVVILGFPVRNAITDRLFRMLGYDPRAIHPSSHEDIMRAAERSPRLSVERWAQIPSWLPRALSAYVAGRLRVAERL